MIAKLSRAAGRSAAKGTLSSSGLSFSDSTSVFSPRKNAASKVRPQQSRCNRCIAPLALSPSLALQLLELLLCVPLATFPVKARSSRKCSTQSRALRLDMAVADEEAVASVNAVSSTRRTNRLLPGEKVFGCTTIN